MKVEVVCGLYRNTFAKRWANRKHLASLGVLRVKCFECEGSGWWGFMKPDVPGAPCINCKGTGKVYIGG